MRGVITPIPKGSATDPRDPLSYRGITFAPSMYKLYCSVLNSRLVAWAELNGLLADEQNGFRSGRSCVDHLSMITFVSETRMKAKQSTYAAFIDFSKAYDRIDRDMLWRRLSDLGLIGNMESAIRQIYQQVQCCVRLNGQRSDWFDVSCGLRQGCILSPLLFNLFVNDLIEAIALKASGRGVKLDGTDTEVGVAAYADDVVLLAASEQDLQYMLDMVHRWCRRWRMVINIDKTKVIHFRTKAQHRTPFVFTCGGDTLQTVDRYKYLGLVLSEHLDYAVTANVVSKSASRALGLLISKVKASGGVPYACFTKLYDALVQPIIDYGAAVWGNKEFTSITSVQARACRFFLGLGKHAPNAAIFGDMGWKYPIHSQFIGVASHAYLRTASTRKSSCGQSRSRTGENVTGVFI